VLVGVFGAGVKVLVSVKVAVGVGVDVFVGGSVAVAVLVGVGVAEGVMLGFPKLPMTFNVKGPATAAGSSINGSSDESTPKKYVPAASSLTVSVSVCPLEWSSAPSIQVFNCRQFRKT
jgi:hypothetical protein